MYSRPVNPTKEKGANADRDLRRHSGNKTNVVTPKSAMRRVTEIPTTSNNSGMVEDKTMEYDTIACRVVKRLAVLGIQLVDSPTDLLHASLYDAAPPGTEAHTRPINEKQYALRLPIIANNIVVGINA